MLVSFLGMDTKVGNHSGGFLRPLMRLLGQVLVQSINLWPQVLVLFFPSILGNVFRGAQRTAGSHIYFSKTIIGPVDRGSKTY